MSESRARGTHEERREQSLERLLDTAEVLVFLDAEDGKLRMRTLPRDEVPNQDSMPVIFAAFLNANWKELAGQAFALHRSAQMEAQAKAEGAIVEASKRSVIDAQGNIARTDDSPKLLGPDGRAL